MGLPFIPCQNQEKRRYMSEREKGEIRCCRCVAPHFYSKRNVDSNLACCISNYDLRGPLCHQPLCGLLPAQEVETWCFKDHDK